MYLLGITSFPSSALMVIIIACILFIGSVFISISHKHKNKWKWKGASKFNIFCAGQILVYGIAILIFVVYKITGASIPDESLNSLQKTFGIIGTCMSALKDAILDRDYTPFVVMGIAHIIFGITGCLNLFTTNTEN